MADRSDDDALWRRCEVAWSAWLQGEGYSVIHLEGAGGSGAPLIEHAGRKLRAPDLESVKGGRTEYWEVKFRTRSDIDTLTGDREHWMSLDAFRDYVAVWKLITRRVWVVLYEAPTAVSEGRWLRADVRHLLASGRQGSKFGNAGVEVPAWIWPTSAMEVVTGPQLNTRPAAMPVLPEEGVQEGIPAATFEPLERNLRARASGVEATLAGDKEHDEPAERVLLSDSMVGLDVLRRSLGVPVLPRYSVLRVGGADLDIDGLLGLLEYGIRVFIVTETELPHSIDPDHVQAFKDARMLEWAVVPGLDLASHWVVDGAFPEPCPSPLLEALQLADESGSLNLRQYRVVHAPADSDVLVTAGAGTGKTETMSERLVFLLATWTGKGPDLDQPYTLRVDDIVLITFTREASREMRSRIARTLMLRQRLARRCALPALAWLMQLSSAEITTIHSYAKHVAKAGAGAVGLSPGFAVAKQVLSFRRIVFQALSPHLENLFARYEDGEVPAAHLWERHVESVWEALVNNGVDLMPLVELSGIEDGIDWGSPAGDGLHNDVVKATGEIVRETAVQFRQLCLDDQAMPPGQLVPTALAALRAQDMPPVRNPRYLFVDEFQDTDASQMTLMLEIRRALDARMFVVGDVKQGIYRFRGAEGNAFEELITRSAKAGLPEFAEHSLTRNFRTGESLLDSLHPYFEAWGREGYLTYGESDRLQPNTIGADASIALGVDLVGYNDFDWRAARNIAEWRSQSPLESLAILCRQNWQAMVVQLAVRDLDLPCELLVGGKFFTSPAVRDLRVLLEAVSQPTDDAALLELCETRWAAGILAGEAPPGVPEAAWADVSPMQGWADRFTTVAVTGVFNRDDVEPLRGRISALGMMLSRMPTLGWLVECARVFAPEACALPGKDDETERAKYRRCLDHLIAVLDSTFAEQAVTLERVLTWLRVQIATNRTEDEPMDAGDVEGKTVALTVHKAKGLEFDRVLIPTTATKFGAPKSVETEASVLRPPGAPPRLLWKWKAGTGQAKFTNVRLEDAALWTTDFVETQREETRLLYVALTRAKTEVLVFLTSGAGSATSPQSWGDLLAMGD